MRAHHRMLGIRIRRLERESLLRRHGGAERSLDAVTGAQRCDPRLDLVRQLFVRQRHVRPHRVAADGWALDAAQDAAHRRRLAPGRVGVPRILVAVDRRFGSLVDLNEPGMLRMTADDRMILERAEPLRECDVVRARDVLIAQEQDLVP
jgi:hypothetical protein